MQVRMLSSRFGANGALSYVAGTQYDIPDDLALQFIGDGVAVDVGNTRAVANRTQRNEPNYEEGLAQVALVSGEWSRYTGPRMAAHRGGAMVYPENSLQGIRAMLSAAVPIIEYDVFLLSGGGIGVIHDGTIDRTTSGTGSTTAQTVANFRALTIDYYATLAAGYIPEPPPLLDDVLNLDLARNAIHYIECKHTAVIVPLIAELRSRAWPMDKVWIYTQTGGPDLATAIAEGFECHFAEGSPTIGDIQAKAAAGYRGYMSTDTAWTDPLATEARRLRMRTAAFTLQRRTQRDAMAALGIDVLISDDPIYMSGLRRSNRDAFTLARWAGGQVSGRSAATNAAGRGTLGANGLTLAAQTAGQTEATLLGFLCPLNGNENADTFTITATVRFETVTADDRWLSIAVCAPTDRPFVPGVQAASCLHVVLRRNGNIGIETSENTGGLSNAPGYVMTGTPVLLGLTTDLTLTITKTPTSFTAVCGPVSATCTSTKTGGYVHFAANGANVSLKSIVVT